MCERQEEVKAGKVKTSSDKILTEFSRISECYFGGGEGLD